MNPIPQITLCVTPLREPLDVDSSRRHAERDVRQPHQDTPFLLFFRLRFLCLRARTRFLFAFRSDFDLCWMPIVGFLRIRDGVVAEREL